MIRPVVSVLERHRHQPLAVPLGAADQRPARRSGVTGLQTDTAVHVTQKLVVIGHGAPADGHRPGGGDAHQGLILHRRAGQKGHVPGGGVVILMVQAIGVSEGAVLHPQISGGLVHHAHESRLTAAHMTRDGHCGIVSGTEHQAVEQRLQRQLLPLFQIHGGTLGQRGLPVDCHNFPQVSLPDRHQRRHNLRGAGDQHLRVGVLLIEYPPTVHIHQNSGRRRGIHRACLTRENTIQ